jgi:FtsH-binding integral membrane protein
MANDPFNSSPPAGGYTLGSSVDAGLQTFMQGIYHTMCWGLAVTGGTAYAVANVPALNHIILQPVVTIVIFLAMLFLSFTMTPYRTSIYRGGLASGTPVPAASIRTRFLIFSVLFGLLSTWIFQVYTGSSIARTFFITAATFAGTSLYGYTTRRDLTSMGSFMVMGLWGICIAMVVNIFLHSAMVYFVTSILSVIIFTGMTAWETQSVKQMYRAGDKDGNDALAVVYAFNLYLNFINLFMSILRLTGDRR